MWRVLCCRAPAAVLCTDKLQPWPLQGSAELAVPSSLPCSTEIPAQLLTRRVVQGEHGTGRNVAPYVEMEWGTKAYNLMWEIKELFDPDYVLNPGVLLNRVRTAHIHLSLVWRAQAVLSVAPFASCGLRHQHRRAACDWRQVPRRLHGNLPLHVLLVCQQLGAAVCAAAGLSNSG